MDRLITFGCSHTYGQALKERETQAWPYIVADKLNLECINEGQMGASITMMYHKLMNFDYQQGDKVICLWSYPNRRHFYESKEEFKDVLPFQATHPEKTTEEKHLRAAAYYDLIFTKYGNRFENRMMIHHSYNYLKSLGVKSYHTYVLNYEDPSLYFESRAGRVPYLKANWNNTWYNGDRGDDNSHGGVGVHKLFAKQILDEIGGVSRLI